MKTSPGWPDDFDGNSGRPMSRYRGQMQRCQRGGLSEISLRYIFENLIFATLIWKKKKKWKKKKWTKKNLARKLSPSQKSHATKDSNLQSPKLFQLFQSPKFITPKSVSSYCVHIFNNWQHVYFCVIFSIPRHIFAVWEAVYIRLSMVWCT